MIIFMLQKSENYVNMNIRLYFIWLFLRMYTLKLVNTFKNILIKKSGCMPFYRLFVCLHNRDDRSSRTCLLWGIHKIHYYFSKIEVYLESCLQASILGTNQFYCHIKKYVVMTPVKLEPTIPAMRWNHLNQESFLSDNICCLQR
jgi:hypothetical protein